jgi:hypothetical protein
LSGPLFVNLLAVPTGFVDGGVRLPSSGCGSRYEPGGVLEIVDEVGHSDLDRGSGDADDAEDEAHPVLRTGDHTLDVSTDFASPGVSPGEPVGC